MGAIVSANLPSALCASVADLRPPVPQGPHPSFRNSVRERLVATDPQDLMTTNVFAIASSSAQAHDIVNRLKAEGFLESDISALLPDKGATRDFAHESHTKAPEGAVAGAGAGASFGATAGLLAGLGLLVLPGFGPFLAAGPLLAALSGAAIGATVGGLSGAVVGFGIPEHEAKMYEGKIQGGNVLLCAHAADHAAEKRAREVFHAAGATDIMSGETVPAPSTSVQYRTAPTLL